MRRSAVFSGFVLVVLFGLSGCGGSKSSRGGADGACRTDLPLCSDAGSTPDTAQPSSSPIDAALGGPPDAAALGVDALASLPPDSGNPKVPCGSGFCPSGRYCCNANCATCVPPSVDCAYQECAPPEQWACTSDDDCRAVDNYCGGCICSLLGPQGYLGTCTKGVVDCYAAPCRNMAARCERGYCVLVAK